MTPSESPLRDRARSPEIPSASAGLAESPPGFPISPQARAGRHWLVRTGVGILVWLLTSSVIVHTEQAPSFALVLEDNAHGVYLSPSCALGRGPFPIETLQAAKGRGVRPDLACQTNGGFLGSSQSVLAQEFAFVHLYPKRGTRWRPDGTWKW